MFFSRGRDIKEHDKRDSPVVRTRTGIWETWKVEGLGYKTNKTGHNLVYGERALHIHWHGRQTNSPFAPEIVSNESDCPLEMSTA